MCLFVLTVAGPPVERGFSSDEAKPPPTPLDCSSGASSSCDDPVFDGRDVAEAEGSGKIEGGEAPVSGFGLVFLRGPMDSVEKRTVKESHQSP